MTGFEPQTSVIGSDHSTYWSTTIFATVKVIIVLFLTPTLVANIRVINTNEHLKQ